MKKLTSAAMSRLLDPLNSILLVECLKIVQINDIDQIGYFMQAEGEVI